MSNNPLNFAPYSSPPRSNTLSAAGASSSSSNGNGIGNSSRAASSRPKSPWFSAGSYQSGAKTSDLASSNHISSSSYHSATTGSSSYAPIASSSTLPHGLPQHHQSQSGDVLFDAENGYAGPSSSMGGSGGGMMGGIGTTTSSGHDAYETAYGWRVDVEAAATYALGPVLAIFLLILETKNDYVRFHAWQSLMLGAGLAVLHLFLLWSRFFTWIMIIADLGLYGNLTYRAFVDGSTLERYFLPKIGELASQWTEEE